jgi:uncharacterized membrane protein YphA (DoxX/SURF4 family)
VNIVLWVLQVLLALAFGLAGLAKTFQPKEKLVDKMTWVEDYSPTQVKIVGVVELLAAIGLILPALTGIAPVLTPLAAAGLVIVMVLAALVHVKRKEYSGIIVNVVLAVLALVIAWGRFGPYGL